VSTSPEAQRLRTAIAMHDFGVRMYRQRLRRERPGATDEDIDEQLWSWLRHRPGAEHGDAVGSPSRRFL
jgi:hypothetical protein